MDGFDGEPVLMQHHKGRKRMHLGKQPLFDRMSKRSLQKLFFINLNKVKWFEIGTH